MGDLAGKIERLEIRCTRCPRHGRVKLDKLLAEHGVDLGMPELAVRLAADCPKAQAPAGGAVLCVFPQLLDPPTAQPTAK